MEELDEHFKKNRFTVPEIYFDSFEDRVIYKLNPASKSGKRLFLSMKQRAAWLSAACISILICIGIFKLGNHSGTDNASFIVLDSMELSEYLNNVELNEDEFDEIITDSNIDSIYNAEIININHSDFSDDEILDLEEEYDALDDTTEI